MKKLYKNQYLCIKAYYRNVFSNENPVTDITYKNNQYYMIKL